MENEQIQSGFHKECQKDVFVLLEMYFTLNLSLKYIYSIYFIFFNHHLHYSNLMAIWKLSRLPRYTNRKKYKTTGLDAVPPTSSPLVVMKSQLYTDNNWICCHSHYWYSYPLR